jgi:two-component sensor histidine kinase
LQGAANILGMAIERQRIEQQLRLAAERNQLLLKEVNHRVNNSLAIVASMLHLKAATVNEEVKAHLDEASQRITAIAGAHKRLYQVDSFERLDLGAYLEDLCKRLSESLNGCVIHVGASTDIDVLPDQAVPIALCVNELITNSAKYGYPNAHCEVWVTISRAFAPSNIVSISVRDKGVGLPLNFDPAAVKGLGMRLVTAFTKQLDGTLEIRRNDPGTEFVISFPGGV